jgi:AraC family transcriptional activator of pobA
MTTRLDRYSELEAVLRRNPPFRMRVAHLAHVLGIGESTLSRNFRRDTGQTLKSYLKEQVVRRSKQALASTLTIKDVEAEFGFDDESYFSKFFKRETGFSPKEYRASLEREFG